MKVLLVHTYLYPNGGDAIYTTRLGKLLESKGHNVAYWGMEDSKNFKHQYSDYELSNIDFKEELTRGGGLRSKLNVAKRAIYNRDARKLIALVIDDFKPDIVHMQSIHYHLTTSIIWEIKKRNIPVVWTQHNLSTMCCNYMLNDLKICERCKERKFYSPLLTRCKKNSFLPSLAGAIQLAFDHYSGVYKKVDRFIAITNFYAKKMIEFGFDQKKIIVVRNFFEPNDVTEPKQVHNRHAPYIIFFGRLSEEKGVETLISAMAKLSSDLRLVIVGSGPMENRLECFSSEMGNLSFVGFKNWGELSGLISNAEFSVVPSIWYENFPNTILESYACGCPVVGARIGGIPEMINEGESGLLFESGNADDLASKINHLMSHPDALDQMRTEARRIALSEYTKNKHYKALIGIYESVLK